MFYLKVHKNLNDTLVAVCDREIIGKSYEENDLRIEVDENFYKGDIVDEEELIENLANSTIANIVGNRAVDTAIKHGLIEEEKIISIGGIKHAQIVVML